MKLKIEKEYERLVPRLSDEEYDSLRQSIKEAGIRTKLQVLDDGTILCGHSRYRIAQELGITNIPYEIVKIQGKDNILLYIIDDNLIRRQLSLIDRCLLGELKEPIIAKINKENQEKTLPKKGQKGFQPNVSRDSRPTLPKTTKEIAKDVGVGSQSYERFKKISKENPKAIITIKKGISSINKEYKKLTEERKIPNMPFRQKHIPMIKNGTKTQTSRGINRWIEGDIVEVVVFEPNMAKVKIESIIEKKLKDFTEADAKQEGGYTLNEFKQVWVNIHGAWNENTVVKVIKFKEVS